MVHQHRRQLPQYRIWRSAISTPVLAKRMETESMLLQIQTTTGSSAGHSLANNYVHAESNYNAEVSRGSKHHDAMTFWSKRQDAYDLLAPRAYDTITASTSQVGYK